MLVGVARSHPNHSCRKSTSRRSMLQIIAFLRAPTRGKSCARAFGRSNSMRGSDLTRWLAKRDPSKVA
jgi:hypothetical protein